MACQCEVYVNSPHQTDMKQMTRKVNHKHSHANIHFHGAHIVTVVLWTDFRLQTMRKRSVAQRAEEICLGLSEHRSV